MMRAELKLIMRKKGDCFLYTTEYIFKEAEKFALF